MIILILRKQYFRIVTSLTCGMQRQVNVLLKRSRSSLMWILNTSFEYNSWKRNKMLPHVNSRTFTVWLPAEVKKTSASSVSYVIVLNELGDNTVVKAQLLVQFHINNNVFSWVFERVCQRATNSCCWRNIQSFQTNYRRVRGRDRPSAKTAGHRLETWNTATQDRFVKLYSVTNTKHTHLILRCI